MCECTSLFNHCLCIQLDIVANIVKIINHAVMTNLVHRYFHIIGGVSLGQIAGSEIAGAKEKHMHFC